MNSGSANTTPGPASDAEIPDYLRRLGIPGLADIHVHFMPQNVLDKVWGFFDQVGERGEQPWPIEYRTPEEQRVETLARLGVLAYTGLNYPHRAGMAGWLNEYSARFAAQHPRAVHSGTFFAEPGAGDTVGEAIGAGARVFKVHIQVGAFSPLDPLLDDAWLALEEAQLPVVIHCGSGPHGGEFTGPRLIGELLRRHPRLVLVIAHAGMPEYAEFVELVRAHPNVYLDTTMVGTDYMQSVAPIPERVLADWKTLGDRMVLGSDFPNIPHSYAHQLAVIAGWGMGDGWMRAVLWENGARLMGVDG